MKIHEFIWECESLQRNLNSHFRRAVPTDRNMSVFLLSDGGREMFFFQQTNQQITCYCWVCFFFRIDCNYINLNYNKANFYWCYVHRNSAALKNLLYRGVSKNCSSFQRAEASRQSNIAWGFSQKRPKPRVYRPRLALLWKQLTKKIIVKHPMVVKVCTEREDDL